MIQAVPHEAITDSGGRLGWRERMDRCRARHVVLGGDRWKHTAILQKVVTCASRGVPEPGPAVPRPGHPFTAPLLRPAAPLERLARGPESRRGVLRQNPAGLLTAVTETAQTEERTSLPCFCPHPLSCHLVWKERRVLVEQRIKENVPDPNGLAVCRLVSIHLEEVTRETPF